MFAFRGLGVMALAALALGACTPDERHARDDRSPQVDTLDAEADTLGSADARPPSLADTLWIEGFPDPVDLSLFVAPETSPDPFSTYLPPDWRAETGDDELEVIFRPDGPLGEDAFLLVRVLDEGVAVNEALEQIERHVTRQLRPHDQRAMATESGYFPGAIREYVFTSGPLGGGAALVQGPRRLAEVYAQYPIEAGDGFGPRQAVVLQHWRWKADGSALQRGP